MVLKLVPKTLNYCEGMLATNYLSRFVLFVCFFLWNYPYSVLIEISLCLLYHWSREYLQVFKTEAEASGITVIALNLDPSAHPPIATSLLIF